MEYFEQPLGLSTEAIQFAMDPERIVKLRTLAGGSAPGEARRQAGLLETSLQADEAWVLERRRQIGDAAAALEAAMDAIVGAG